MSFWSDLGNGIVSYFKAIGFVFKHGLWYYFLFPLVLVAGLYLLGYYSIDRLNDFITDIIKNYLGGNVITSVFTGFFLKAIMRFISSMLKPFLLIMMGLVIQYLVLIICSPIMGSLSASTDRIITKKEFRVGFFRFIFNLFRGLIVVLRNLALQLLITIPLVLVFWLPIIGWLVFPLFFIFTWYFIGFNIMDYTYERRRMGIGEGARFTRKHKGMAIAIGFLFSLLLIIPYAGIALAVVLAPVASTMCAIEKMETK